MTTEADAERSYAEKYARWEAEYGKWWNQLTPRERVLVKLAASKPRSRLHTVLLFILDEVSEE